MITKKYYSLAVSLVFWVLIVSCGTAKDVVPQTIQYNQSEQVEGEINRLIKDDKPAEALQWILHYKNSGDMQDIDFTRQENEALSGMVEKFEKALKRKEYPQAISLYCSLGLIHQEMVLPETLDLGSLKTAYLKYLTEIDRTGAAAGLISYGYVDLSLFTDEDLVFLESHFTKGENKKALSMIVAEMQTRGLPLRDETASFLNEKVTMENLIKGTVTVWVDRGLRFEKGVGYPDRVIGSGFFIDKSGYLLTNYHVIESEVDPEYQGHSKLFIKLSDDRGEKIPARVVGWDRHFDLALLKTEIEAPYVFSFSSDDQYSLGQKIFAIGSPGGLNNSITSGTVSAIRRPLLTMGETVQIDVPINPGNSGGPLLNPDGRVKGVIFAGIEDFEGINFAINGSYVKSLLPDLYAGGALTHPWIGLGGYQEFDYLEALYIVPHSPASRVGITRGDRILRINGIDVTRNQDVRDILLEMEPGSMVQVEWETNGKTQESVITLAERPDIPLAYAINNDSRERLIPALFGMVLEQVRKEQYRVSKVYTGSAADEASISANDVITLKKWIVNEKDGYVLMQFLFKGVKAGYLESAIQLGAPLESPIFF